MTVSCQIWLLDDVIYVPRKHTGRCMEGERDRGRLHHAVPATASFAPALCGAVPGRRTPGWSEHLGEAVTCPRCLKACSRSEREAE